jgi:hypothetical protein
MRMANPGGIFMNQDELLMKEYEAITALIVHWDKFFYETSKFYLIIESAFLAGVIIRLSAELVDEKSMQPGLFYLAVFITLFNLFICYVWFRADRSCREYLKVTFQRALRIEEDPVLRGVIQLYHFEQDKVNQTKYVNHSSSWWEEHVPIVFMIAWVACLILAAFDSHDLVAAIIVGVTIVLVIGAIKYIERTGWPYPGVKRPIPGNSGGNPK